MMNVVNDPANQSKRQSIPKIPATWVDKAAAAFRQAIAGRNRQQRRMQLIETLQLGGKRQLMLIECDGQEYLVGAGPDTVHSIARKEASPIASANKPPSPGEEADERHRESTFLPLVQKARVSF